MQKLTALWARLAALGAPSMTPEELMALRRRFYGCLGDLEAEDLRKLVIAVDTSAHRAIESTSRSSFRLGLLAGTALGATFALAAMATATAIRCALQ